MLNELEWTTRLELATSRLEVWNSTNWATFTDCYILATCTTKEVARSLSLNYGVITTIVPFVKTTDDIIKLAREEAIRVFGLKEKDKVLITGGFSKNTEKRITNFMKIEEI